MHAADYTTPTTKVKVTELSKDELVGTNEHRVSTLVRAVQAGCAVTLGAVTNPPTYVLGKNETVELPHLYCGPIWVSMAAVVTEILIHSA